VTHRVSVEFVFIATRPGVVFAQFGSRLRRRCAALDWAFVKNCVTRERHVTEESPRL
jgi:hypothetical protein